MRIIDRQIGKGRKREKDNNKKKEHKDTEERGGYRKKGEQMDDSD